MPNYLAEAGDRASRRRSELLKEDIVDHPAGFDEFGERFSIAIVQVRDIDGQRSGSKAGGHLLEFRGVGESGNKGLKIHEEYSGEQYEDASHR